MTCNWLEWNRSYSRQHPWRVNECGMLELHAGSPTQHALQSSSACSIITSIKLHKSIVNGKAWRGEVIEFNKGELNQYACTVENSNRDMSGVSISKSTVPPFLYFSIQIYLHQELGSPVILSQWYKAWDHAGGFIVRKAPPSIPSNIISGSNYSGTPLNGHP